MTRITLAAAGIAALGLSACQAPCTTAEGFYVSQSICGAHKAREAEQAARREAAKTEPAKPNNEAPRAGDDTEEPSEPRAVSEPALKPYTVRTIRDKHGIRQGTLEQRPNGELVIKDKWGIRQGTVSPAK